MSFQDEHLPEYALPADMSSEERLLLSINNLLSIGEFDDEEISQDILKLDLTESFKDLT